MGPSPGTSPPKGEEFVRLLLSGSGRKLGDYRLGWKLDWREVEMFQPVH